MENTFFGRTGYSWNIILCTLKIAYWCEGQTLVISSLMIYSILQWLPSYYCGNIKRIIQALRLLGDVINHSEKNSLNLSPWHESLLQSLKIHSFTHTTPLIPAQYDKVQGKKREALPLDSIILSIASKRKHSETELCSQYIYIKNSC